MLRIMNSDGGLFRAYRVLRVMYGDGRLSPPLRRGGNFEDRTPEISGI